MSDQPKIWKEMTNDELIARAEAALEGVTDGPWVQNGGNQRAVGFGTGYGPKIAQASVFADWKPVEEKRAAYATAEANARFIAASRQAVPDLIAALKASEARVKELIAFIDRANDGECGACGTIRRLHDIAHRPVFKSTRTALKGGAE